MNRELNNDCTVLITSCCAYKDVLKNFEFFFKKNWEDCPFNIVLNVDKPIDTDFPYDEIVVSPHPENLIRMRDVKIETPFVLLMQDDHWLIQKVETKKILNAIELAKKYNTGNLRLIQDPRTDTIFSEKEDLLEYKPGKSYRISARGGLWRTDYLYRFINKFKDFWEMEQQGQSFSCKDPSLVLCTKNRVLPMIDAVHKGMYEDFAIALLEMNDIIPERMLITAKRRLISTLKAYIIDLNPELVTGVQSFLHAGHKQKYK